MYWASAEKWDGKTAPIVCFIETQNNPYKDQAVTAYDAKGNAIAVNEKIAKERPVIVLIRNERTDASGKVKKGLAFETPKGNGQKNDALAQANMTKFRLIAPHFNDDYELWFNGNPEFYAVIMKRPQTNPLDLVWAAEWAMWNNGFPGITSGECGSNSDGEIYIWRMADYNITYDWYYEEAASIDVFWMEHDPLWGRGMVYIGNNFSIPGIDENDTYVSRVFVGYNQTPHWIWTASFRPPYLCRHLTVSPFGNTITRTWYAW